MSLDAFQALVNDLVQNKDQVVSSSSFATAIDQAVLTYSADFPRAVTTDQAAEGGVELSYPSAWEVAFSELLSIEYPVDGQELDITQVRTRFKPDAVVFRLPIEIPAGELVRLRYTQRHVMDADLQTVPNTHCYAVACLAASILCGQLQSYYASESAPTVQADVADHQGKAERYRARSKDLAAEYRNQLGLNAKRTAAAAQVAHMQGTDSEGHQRLFHSRRYRR